VERRFSGKIISKIDDNMEFTKSEGRRGILVFLAFDSIEWEFLYKCFEVFKFGPDFKKWVSVLYTDISSCVCNNGVHLNFFIVERGVCQGDPLFSYLFVIAVEFLAVATRTNND